MKRLFWLPILHLGLACSALTALAADSAPATNAAPKVVNPGPPPADAIVLFDGKDLSAWQHPNGKPANWAVKDGEVTVTPKTGDLVTRRPFGDCQLHLEWAAPTPAVGEGQNRGNSGIKFMGYYELQVLDSYQSATYFNGQAGAIYLQHAPQVNASRPPGEWQTYDVIFHAPRFDAAGKVTTPATLTALLNGVLVQDHATVLGKTGGRPPAKYTAHAEKLPLLLQDHSCPVRYRNIWIREL